MKRLIYAEDAMHRIEMETRFYSGTYAEIERAIERAIDSAPTVDPRCLRPVEEWISDSGVCFCGASPYCADFTDGDDGCCYWQQKEPVTQSPADTEGTE